MEPKEFDVEFPRGDTYPFSLVLKDNSGNLLIPGDGDEIYFTVKKSYNSQDYIMQKRFSSGELTVEDSIIHFVLSHNDTADLKYGNYVYDIELVSGDYVKTVMLGTITLTNEATWISNE